jgi:hypothetical protein
MNVSGTSPFEKLVIDESMIIMNTTPEAPRSTTFGKRKAFESPVTSAVMSMLISKKPEPYALSRIGPRSKIIVKLLIKC